MRIALIALVFLAAFAVSPSPALDITTRLLDAEVGSWIRNDRRDHYSYIYYVAAANRWEVLIYVIHQHKEHILSNKAVRISKTYIEEKGINPESPSAQRDTIELDGAKYDVKRVDRTENGETVRYYFLDSQPVTGILRKEVDPDSGPARITTNYQSSGLEPDDIIKRAGTGTDANAEFGIPIP